MAAAELLGESAAIVTLRDEIERLVAGMSQARRLPPVFVRGETGTGKGLVARLLHQRGPRAQAPFIDVNCAAIPETLMEAEMFGFERGAFTDARQSKAGLFQVAHRGTIFLDEIGLLPEGLQGKLLKAIEEQSVRRIGGLRPEPADVWILTATSGSQITLRPDLYHRLAVVTLTLPPLRDRGDDIVLLAEDFLRRACADYGRPAKTLAADARRALLAYRWPGNVRELMNVIERVALLTMEATVCAGDLHLPMQPAPLQSVSPAAKTAADEGPTVEQLRTALSETGWNISRAAARLGTTRRTVRYRIEKFDLRRESGLAPPSASGVMSPGVPAESRTPSRAIGVPERIVDPAPHRDSALIAFLRASVGDADAPPAMIQSIPLVQELMETIEHFGGRVEDADARSLGAVFGLDTVDDAPAGAAYAALALTKVLARREGMTSAALRLRIGLHVRRVRMFRSTTALVIDADDKREVSPILDRLVQAFGAGVCISEAAVPFLERRFEIASPSRTDDSGSRHFRLVGLEQTGFGLGGRSLSPFVGRGRELDTLREFLRDIETGTGHAVALVGDAGIGKSRLLYEFRESLAEGRIRYFSGRCVPHGSAVPYLPLLEILRQACGIHETDALALVEERVSETLHAVRMDPTQSAPYLLHALGMAGGSESLATSMPETIKVRTFEVFRELLFRLGRRHPVVLAVEDLHWIDKTSEDFLATLVENLAGVPVLVLATYRRGYHPAWLEASYATQLVLRPLSAEDGAAIVASVLGTSAADHLSRVILDRADGNPFFLEELAWAAANAGDDAEAGAIPPTLHEALLTRIGRLPEELRRLLQTASVLGRDASVELLQAVWDGAEPVSAQLRELQRREFVHVRSGFDKPAYAFKHALTQDVAYESMAIERRRAMHARSVKALEDLYGDRLGEHVEELAHHAVRGEILDKAVLYLRQAGQKAAGRSALEDARVWFEQALKLVDTLPETPAWLEQAFEIRLELRPVLNQLGEARRTLERLREAESLAERLNDDRRHARVCALMTNIHTHLGELDEALVSGTRAREIARESGDLELRILSTSYLEQVHYARGEYERVIDLASDNLAALPADWTYEYFGNVSPTSVWDRVWLVMTLAHLGRFSEAAEHEAATIRIAEPTHHAHTIGWAHLASGTLQLVEGDWSSARSPIERAITVFRSGNVVNQLTNAVTSSAWVMAQLGEASEALNRLREGEQLLERQAARGYVGHSGWAYCSLGRASVLLGRLDAARRLADRAVESSPCNPGFKSYALHLLGDIAIHPDRFDAENAEAHYRASLALAEPRGMRPLVAHCHFGLGKLYRRTEKRQQAAQHFNVATALYREMEMTYWLEQADTETSA